MARRYGLRHRWNVYAITLPSGRRGEVSRRVAAFVYSRPVTLQGTIVSKARDQKREEKKKPLKTKEEKRAAKREKRAAR